jgi:carboxyl-terminal processing protease
MVDAETVGESTRDTALPWDRIQPTRFRPASPLTAAIDDLRAHQVARATNDPDFGYLLSDVAAAKELNAQTSVSLNREERVAENKRMDEGRLARENSRRTALGLEALTSIEELDDVETSDAILLHQAARVVAELVERTRSSP